MNLSQFHNLCIHERKQGLITQSARFYSKIQQPVRRWMLILVKDFVFYLLVSVSVPLRVLSVHRQAFLKHPVANRSAYPPSRFCINKHYIRRRWRRKRIFFGVINLLKWFHQRKHPLRKGFNDSQVHSRFGNNPRWKKMNDKSLKASKIQRFERKVQTLCTLKASRLPLNDYFHMWFITWYFITTWLLLKHLYGVRDSWF